MKPSIKKRTNHGKVKWVLDLRRFGGGREFFDEKIQAEQAAEKSSSELVRLGRSAFDLSSQDRLEFLTAKERLAKAGLTITQATDFTLENFKAREEKTIQSAIGEILSAKRKAGLRDSYLRVFEVHLEHLNKDPQKLVSSFKREDIAAILDNDEWSLSTKRSYKIGFGTFFTFCKKRHWLTKNPCDDLESIVLDEKLPEVLTVEQASIFIKSVRKTDKKLVRYFADQLFGGLREDEAQRLRKEDSKESHVEVMTKLRSYRFVDFNPTWKAWRELGKPEYAPIFSYKRRVLKVKMAAKAAMVKAKLVSADWWYPRNCFRHSFCSYAAPILGASRAADLAGHSEKVQKDHYRRPVSKEVAMKFWEIMP